MLSVTFTPTATSDYATATATTSITVMPAVPVLSFVTVAPQMFGGAPFVVNATSASSGAVTYAVVSGPAMVVGNLVTLTGAGTVVLQVRQTASGNYATATATTSFTVGTPGFVLTSGAVGPAQVMPGGTVTYSLMWVPAGTAYPDPVSLSVSGLPPGATFSFSPSMIAAGSPGTPITLTIQTSNNQTGRNVRSISNGVSLPVVLSFLLLPWVGLKRARTGTRHLSVLLGVLVLSLGVVLGLSGCGGSNGFFSQAPQTYTVKVTATDVNTGVAVSTNVILTVQ
jgi:hypothetical protein